MAISSYFPWACFPSASLRINYTSFLAMTLMAHVIAQSRTCVACPGFSSGGRTQPECGDLSLNVIGLLPHLMRGFNPVYVAGRLPNIRCVGITVSIAGWTHAPSFISSFRMQLHSVPLRELGSTLPLRDCFVSQPGGFPPRNDSYN